jgi:hypothetical protein
MTSGITFNDHLLTRLEYRGWRIHRFEAVRELAEASVWIFVRVSRCFAER